MTAKVTRNLHVPLSEPLHERLRAEAARSGWPATNLAREAIESYVTECERHAVHEAIVDYASDMAGSPAELDEDLERAGVAHLASGRRKP